MLREADVVIGYRPYLRYLEGVLRSDQVVEGSGMGEEVSRARRALALARAGHYVAVVSSGDPGVYGMAGLMLEVILSEGAGQEVGFEVVPGVTAALAGAALLGAPLMHDFAVISLSDLLTPWEVIARRLEAAAWADFVIVLYNPRSRKRTWQLEEARRILLQYRSPQTPVGVVNAAGRPGQQVFLSTLAAFLELPVTMDSLVLVGNSQTFARDGYLVTPRGYKIEKPS